MKNTFIEIGAGSDGKWGIELLKKGFTGYFVEPHPGNLIQLQSRLIRNNICESKYVLLNFGVWVDSGIQIMNTEKFLLNETADSFHLKGSDPFYKKGLKRRRPVSYSFGMCCVKFSELLEYTSRPEYILMNIEGAEIPVILSHSWDYSPIRLEVYFHDMNQVDGVSEHLEEQGFSMVSNHKSGFVYEHK